MRRIIHVDMDAFYASVEQRDDPRLPAGRSPSADSPTGAASWRRRLRGPRLWRPVGDVDGEGRRLCPSLVVVPPDFARYKAASSAVFTLFREVTPLVEPLSLDERTWTSPRTGGASRWRRASRNA
jgi:DNA polymerase-4